MPNADRTTPENITRLEPGEIFVFGSNTGGRHGKGAALTAKRKFGAEQFIPEGITGNCYALPTVLFHDGKLKKMPLTMIEQYVNQFIRTAVERIWNTFLVTPVGCGLAGYTPQEIAPMFRYATVNVIIPQCFWDVIKPKT